MHLGSTSVNGGEENLYNLKNTSVIKSQNVVLSFSVENVVVVYL